MASKERQWLGVAATLFTADDLLYGTAPGPVLLIAHAVPAGYRHTRELEAAANVHSSSEMPCHRRRRLAQ